MASTETFHCSVVTPEKAILECEATFVAFPSHDGEIGILPRRSPLLCRLGIGTMRVETGNGEKTFFVDGGFAQMVDNRLTILTEQATEPTGLDLEAARSAFEEAKLMGTQTEREFQERQNALQRARVQMQLSRNN